MKKLKFSVNTHYKGKLVGPDAETDTTEVNDFWAKQFIENNAATEVVEPKAPVQNNQLPK
jgi:hypothetical protein